MVSPIKSGVTGYGKKKLRAGAGEWIPLYSNSRHIVDSLRDEKSSVSSRPILLSHEVTTAFRTIVMPLIEHFVYYMVERVHVDMFTIWSNEYTWTCLLYSRTSTRGHVNYIVGQVHLVMFTIWSNEYTWTCLLYSRTSTRGHVNYMVGQVHLVMLTI